MVLLLAVASAAVLVAGSRFRRWKFSFEWDTHCRCFALQEASPQSPIVFHSRKGAASRDAGENEMKGSLRSRNG